MSVVLGAIVPHPPIIIPEVGRQELSKVAATREAMQKVARRVKEVGPEALVVISPHSPVFRDAVSLAVQPKLQGSFAPFGAPRVSYTVANDLELVREIRVACRELEVPVAELTDAVQERFGIREELDHGVLVPLYYFREEGIVASLVVVGIALLPPEVLYNFGRALALASARRGKRVVVVASSDLSHRLTPDAPAGYDEKGRVFDAEITEAVRKWNVRGITGIDPRLAEQAGECGWRSIIMLSGSLDGFMVESQVLSYEGPFGVGYMVAVLTPGEYLGGKGGEAEKQGRVRGESEYVKLARRSLETYVREGKRLDVPHPLPPGMERRAGAFVSLKKHGMLRGCIGTVEPTQDNLAAEIIANAVSAGVHDPRFHPVQADELSQLTYSVDVLSPAEPIAGVEELDPYRYGVIVKSGRRTGLLLPNLEGVTTAGEQVEIASQKAGIRPGEPVELYRFGVERYY
ncbi:MAG TPA: AmmeMemoRadiSam system protein A [Firmicutes bacterium]|jgi:AmmeMemoRadiSam system protein A|nr:AmmeMemoRadiSam system protein A [Bacillota bacterium]